MDLKESFKGLLHQARWFTDKMLDEIENPEDWIRRAAPGTNHALWIAGHLGHAQNGFVSMADPTKGALREEFKGLFGKGSQPLDDLAAYPLVADIREYLRDRQNVFLEVLDAMDPADFARPTPEGAPKFLPNVGSLFPMWAWHETIHSGQLSTVHRVLGNQALSDRS